MQDDHDKPESVVVPRLHCPIAPAISPYALRLNRRLTRWTRAAGLHSRPEQSRRHLGADLGTFAARVCPDAAPDRLTLFGRWLSFGLFFDDEFFGHGPGGSTDRTKRRAAADAAMAAVSAFVPGGMPSGMPSGDLTRLYRLDVLTDLLVRTANLARPEQFSRFGTQLTLWFCRRLCENPVPPGQMAFGPCLTLAEIVTDCPITSTDLADTDLRRLTDLAAARTAWCDRMHFAAGRQSVDELIAKLPPLLRHSARTNPQRAMDQASRVHDETMREYLRLEKTIAAQASPAVIDYLDLLRGWTRGHYDWRTTILSAGLLNPPTAAELPPPAGLDVRLVMPASMPGRPTVRGNALSAD